MEVGQSFSAGISFLERKSFKILFNQLVIYFFPCSANNKEKITRKRLTTDLDGIWEPLLRQSALEHVCLNGCSMACQLTHKELVA